MNTFLIAALVGLKLLTFDVSGDVSAGAELTVSVGQRSANYDWVVPKSALHNDSNGDFVYKVESKNSPLGNRYVARRVNVEILAMDCRVRPGEVILDAPVPVALER